MGKPGESDARMNGGVVGMLLGGAAGGGGHWAAENFIPSMKGKLNKNTMIATAVASAALGAYIGAVEMWETYLPSPADRFKK